MVSSKERWLSHLRLRLAQKHHPDQLLSFLSALDVLRNHPSFGTQEFVFSDARWITQLLAIDPNTHSEYVTLLFLSIDKDRAAVVYGNVNTLALTATIKNDDDGVAATTHLVIRKSEEAEPDTHYALLEDIEGLSRTKVVIYLQHLLEKFVDFPSTDPKDKGKAFKSTLHNDIVLDKPIGEQLDEARLLSVDVLRRAKSSTIDKKAAYYERTRLIEYKPRSKPIGEVARGIVSQILQTTDRDTYPEVRIRVQEPEGQQRTVGVDRTLGDALAGAFQLRTFEGNISPTLPEASKSLVQHLITAIIRHFPPKRK